MAVIAGRTIAAVIALAAGLALLIGWRRGFNRSSLELAAATFAVVLSIQTVGLVVLDREIGDHYWPIVLIIACGWVVCVWLGSRARNFLAR